MAEHDGAAGVGGGLLEKLDPQLEEGGGAKGGGTG
jgi:hypothetical protein